MEKDTVADQTATELLTEDVTQADLTKYADHQLEGRRAYYEREALFERDYPTREALKGELHRTNLELDRRRAMRMAEAERVFA
jgi:hypothetical protein